MGGTGIIRAGRRRALWLALGVSLAALPACSGTEQIFTHGAIISQDQLELIPVGSSKDQVLLAIGSPSTVGQFDNEVYYYITQKSRKRVAYDKARLVDQRVLAVYFDKEETVVQVANYGLQDGKVFDFITRTTPTGGKDLSFLGQILMGGGGKLPDPGQVTPGGLPGSKI